MIKITESEKFSVSCANCGKRFKSNKSLKEITIYRDSNLQNGIVVGNFCKKCLRELGVQCIKES